MKRGRLITVGSFDGVHRGHQALLKMAVKEAQRRKLRCLALTFEVPPKMVLEKKNPPSLLSSPDEKAALVRSQGVDEVEFLKFDKRLSRCRPFYFFREILLKLHRAKGLVVGFDFRFGEKRSGGARDLVDWGLEYEIPVWVVPPVRWNKTVVSSTLIRHLLEEGKYSQAQGFLGHPYLIHGRVVRGQRLGRRLGFATANLKTARGKALPPGVFAVRGTIGQRWSFQGVCNIGTRPTVSRKKDRVVEVHVLQGAVPKTGDRLWVELLKRLRNEKRFSSRNALSRAIATDSRRAQKYFGWTETNLYRGGLNSL